MKISLLFVLLACVLSRGSLAASTLIVRGMVTELSQTEVVMTTPKGKKLHLVRSRLPKELAERVSNSSAQASHQSYTFSNSVLKECTPMAMCGSKKN